MSVIVCACMCSLFVHSVECVCTRVYMYVCLVFVHGVCICVCMLSVHGACVCRQV